MIPRKTQQYGLEPLKISSSRRKFVCVIETFWGYCNSLRQTETQFQKRHRSGRRFLWLRM